MNSGSLSIGFRVDVEGWKLSTLSFSGSPVLLKEVLTHCPANKINIRLLWSFMDS